MKYWHKLWIPPWGSSGLTFLWDQELSGDSAAGEAAPVQVAGDLTLHLLASLKETNTSNTILVCLGHSRFQ